MKEVNLFVIGGLFALFAFGFLFLAAQAGQGPVYVVGLGLFLFCTLLIFVLIGETGRHRGKGE